MFVRRVVVLVALTGFLALPSAAGAAPSAGDFLKSFYVMMGHGQFGRAWDGLHPAQQRFITRGRFIDCAMRSLPYYDVTRWKVLETHPEKALLPGTRLRVSTRAVTVQYTLADAAGGEHAYTGTSHAINVHGKWRWAFPPADIAKIKRGKCWR